MGKCKFIESWLENVCFRNWLTSVANPDEARCILCKKTFKLGTMGVKAVESHMQCEKHKTAAKSHELTPAISQFCVSAPGTAPQTTVAAAATSTDLRAAFGATPTLKSEVLWILNTVVKHQSYNSNEVIGDLFRLMFPDSQIVYFWKGQDGLYNSFWSSAFHQKRANLQRQQVFFCFNVRRD